MNERLKQIRESKGMTQKEFAEQIGTSQQTISMFENNSRQMSLRYIKLICAAFNINEDWLRTGSGEMSSVTESSILDEICEKNDINETGRKIFEDYLALKPERRGAIIKFFKDLTDSIDDPDQ